MVSPAAKVGPTHTFDISPKKSSHIEIELPAHLMPLYQKVTLATQTWIESSINRGLNLRGSVAIKFTITCLNPPVSYEGTLGKKDEQIKKAKLKSYLDLQIPQFLEGMKKTTGDSLAKIGVNSLQFRVDLQANHFESGKSLHGFFTHEAVPVRIIASGAPPTTTKVDSQKAVLTCLPERVDDEKRQGLKQPEAIATQTLRLTKFNLENVFSYSNYRGNKTHRDALLLQQYSGLKETNKLDRLLAEQNYVEILAYLWTEPHHSKIIGWLEEKVKQGHAILMLELGLTYFEAMPTVATYVERSVPWIMTGSRIASLDALCTSNKLVSAMVTCLNGKYYTALIKFFEKKIGEEQLNLALKAKVDLMTSKTRILIAKYLDPYITTDQSKLPSPRWAFAHQPDRNQIPESEWAKIRRAKAEEIRATIQ